MELVPVMAVGDEGLASIVKGVLEQAGIEAMIGGGGAAGAYPTPAANPYHILVREADAERAREVLALYDTMADDEDAADDGE
jgi:hypothetical protein